MHVRRLRAKLGSDNEALIGTVRNVGYKFVPPKADPAETSSAKTGPASRNRTGAAGRRAGNGAAPHDHDLTATKASEGEQQ